MKKIFYFLLIAGLTLGFTSCDEDNPVPDDPQTENPSDGDNNEDGDDNEGTQDSDNPSLAGKTLIVYYSFTNNTHTIMTDLQSQIDADIIRVEPAEKGIDYAADNYAIGSALIAAIRENPNEASSYPAIDPVEVNFDEYSTIFIGAPLWWSNMAAPLQTFLFHYGRDMAGKNIGLVVSSASSGISEVESDAKRLIPDGYFLSPSLWIRSSQTSNCHSMITEWLESIGYVKQ